MMKTHTETNQHLQKTSVKSLKEPLTEKKNKLFKNIEKY